MRELSSQLSKCAFPMYEFYGAVDRDLNALLEKFEEVVGEVDLNGDGLLSKSEVMVCVYVVLYDGEVVPKNAVRNDRSA